MSQKSLNAKRAALVRQLEAIEHHLQFWDDYLTRTDDSIQAAEQILRARQVLWDIRHQIRVVTP